MLFAGILRGTEVCGGFVNSRTERKRFHRQRMRTLNRIVLAGCALFVPLYLAIRLTGGSVEKLDQLPDLLGRIKTPIVWHVPDDGVTYTSFFHGPAEEGSKFVVVRVKMEARMKIGYEIVPKCFRLVDDFDIHHYPRSHSPLFISRGDRFQLDRDDTVDAELLFEIPEQRSAERLLFERYQDAAPQEEPGDDHADA